ncbi:uncharacterized protein [Clytia hemisphaerica]|uniref:uncharacterized protein n=1 Tax=Clytia hemisphaerica TaxID=252671 RepID=UPI0034D5C7E4
MYRNDVILLRNVLNIPDTVRCKNRTICPGLEAFCMFLRRFAYPCRYGDMIPRFGRPVPEICMITNYIVEHVYSPFSNKLTDLNPINQPWLSPVKLQEYADAIHAKGAALENCWGFVDGTVLPLCRPGERQRIVYNGHKRVHALKFQSVVAPNGLIANLYGPMEGRRHDCALLNASGLLQDLQNFSNDAAGNPLCIYGDPAYPIRAHLISPFQGAQLNNNQKAFNTAMSTCRISVEWVFNDIINYFKFIDFKKNLKVGLSPIGKMYIVCALLHNARSCFYPNNTSKYFDVLPPTVEIYFA